jgi:hypothetical protein
VSQAAETAVRDAAGVSALLRVWLERSLLIDGRGIESGGEARALFAALTGERRTAASRVLPMRPAPVTPRAEVEPREIVEPGEVVMASRPAVVETPIVPVVVEAGADFLSTAFPTEAAPAEAPSMPAIQPEPAASPVSASVAPAAGGAASVPAAPVPPAVVTPPSAAAPPAPVASAGVFVAPSSAQELSPFEREVLAGRIPGTTVAHGPAFGGRTEATEPRRFGPLAIVALVQAAILVWLAASAWLSAPPEFGMQPGASQEHVLTRNGQPSTHPAAIAVGPEFSWLRVTTPPAIGVTPSKPEDATLRISSPMPLKVMKGSKTLGSIPGAELKLAPGRHEIELVNEAVEYRLAQAIEVVGGESILLQVAPRPGTITLEAAVGTEVTIDGRSIGRTPMAAVTLAPGVYDVVFRYAKGANDRQRVTVKTDATTSVVARSR